MSDLIDRGELVGKTEILYQHTESGKIIPWSAVRVCEINNAPTVDAEPVRHGEWVRRNSNVYCTVCNKGYRISNGGANVFKFKRCPECGAKMDGGKENA